MPADEGRPLPATHSCLCRFSGAADMVVDECAFHQQQREAATARLAEVATNLLEPSITHTLVLRGELVLSEVYMDSYRQNRELEQRLESAESRLAAQAERIAALEAALAMARAELRIGRDAGAVMEAYDRIDAALAGKAGQS